MALSSYNCCSWSWLLINFSIIIVSIFFVKIWIKSGCICPERTSGTCMVSVSLSPMPKPMLEMGTLFSAHAKIAWIKGNGLKLSLYECTWLPGVHAKLYDKDYTWRGWCECSIGKQWWYVAMPNVAIHDANEEPGVNTKPMAIVNDVFRNALANDTEDNDGISQLLRNVETTCLSERQLRKREKIRQDGKTPLYKNCPMSKLEADIMM